MALSGNYFFMQQFFTVMEAYYCNFQAYKEALMKDKWKNKDQAQDLLYVLLH